MEQKIADSLTVAVPVRGVGCIIPNMFVEVKSVDSQVAVPVRGVGCISDDSGNQADSGEVAVPARGVGCIQRPGPPPPRSPLPSPRGVWVASVKMHNPYEAFFGKFLQIIFLL